MASLPTSVELQRFLGPLNDEIEAVAAGIDVPIAACDTLAGGFSRNS